MKLLSLLTIATLSAVPTAALADGHGHHYGHNKHDRRPNYRVVSRPIYYSSYSSYYPGYGNNYGYVQPSYNYVQPQTVVVQQPVTYVQQAAETDSRYCREFTRTIYVGGRQQQGYGTACMQPDGAWEMID